MVTIGAYDGVHLGHQAVIAEVTPLAAELGARSAVVTFDRHPAAVVRPESAPLLLTDLDQKLELLERDRRRLHGASCTFDERRASKEPAEDFVERCSSTASTLEAVVVGEDFHFGHQRRGNVALLREMGATTASRSTAAAHGLVATTGDRTAVSSTAIRQALAGGDVDAADRDARPPARGAGHSRRRRPAGPRARLPDRQRRGARRASCCRPTASTPAGTSGPTARCTRPPSPSAAGRRSTTSRHSLLEAHLLDFDGDLYGEPPRCGSWPSSERAQVRLGRGPGRADEG